jgi:hypothetical protein
MAAAARPLRGWRSLPDGSPAMERSSDEPGCAVPVSGMTFAFRINASTSRACADVCSVITTPLAPARGSLGLAASSSEAMRSWNCSAGACSDRGDLLDLDVERVVGAEVDEVTLSWVSEYREISGTDVLLQPLGGDDGEFNLGVHPVTLALSRTWAW